MRLKFMQVSTVIYPKQTGIEIGRKRSNMIQYLCVTIDKRLSWISHTKGTEDNPTNSDQTIPNNVHSSTSGTSWPNTSRLHARPRTKVE